jgi:ribosomal protein S18 acetylase RimI-like enzyme
MVTVRSLSWPADRPALLALDTSFVTDRVYQVMHTNRSFTLNAVSVTPPLRKDYLFANEVDTLPAFDHVMVAKIDETLVGVAALKIEDWNRRAILVHFYLAPADRGHGVGRILMNHVTQIAQTQNVRCVWLETQNINYGAIQFYQRVGFQWCGLDTSLYDPHSNATQECALFFVRQLT